MTFRARPAKNPDGTPKTRRELLQHLWAFEDLRSVDVFKTGPVYVVLKGRVLCATHTRCIDDKSFKQWEQFARTAPHNSELMR